MKRRVVIFGAICALILSVGGAAPAVSAAASHSGTEHFLVLQTDVNDPAPVLIGRGPIHAAGKDIQVSGSRDRFVFPKGVVRIRHHATKHHEAFDPTTCLGTFTESGLYTVTGGSGAYTDVQGHGTYSLKAYFVGCDQDTPPSLFSLQINAHGPLSY